MNPPWYLSTTLVEKEISIQPPGEPWEHHLGEVRTKMFELHKISTMTKWPEKKAKKLKIRSQHHNYNVFGKLLWKSSKIAFWGPDLKNMTNLVVWFRNYQESETNKYPKSQRQK